MTTPTATQSRIRFPRLRPIDIKPYMNNGEPYFLLQDPLELNGGGLLVPQELAPLLSLCDGSQENGEKLSLALRLRFGIGCSPEEVDEFLAALDKALLLENERSAAASRAAQNRFREAPVREPTLAGLSYPEDPHELTKQLDEFVATASVDETLSIPARGIFSPHIDYPRGGHVYAHAWKAAAEAVQNAKLVIVIGTDHYGSDRFTLTRQSYATPYGVLPTRIDIVDELAQAIDEENAFRGELRHLREHSLELVAIWLHYIRQGRPVDLVPILCGSLHDCFVGPDPVTKSDIKRFLNVLTPYAQDPGTLVIASGDLAHVGPAFGGAPLTARERDSVREADEKLMGALSQGDADAFFASVSQINDKYNVCGITPGYLTLQLLGESRGRVLAYDSCSADSLDTSAVTICSATLE